MDIHHLRIFAAVYRTRGFSRASEVLHLSQPTVSEHIKNMEEELGCRLFDRVGRTIIPTREAEVIYPKAVQIMEELEGLKEAATLAGSAVKGELIIGASTIPGTYILPAVASEFKRLNPGVSFEVIIGDSRRVTEMVLDHVLRLGIVGAVMEPGRLSYQRLIEDELVLVASPRVVKKEVLDVEEIRRVPLVMREEGSGTRKAMEAILGERGVEVKELKVAAVLGSTDSVKQALKADLGASVLSRIAVKEEVRSGLLKEIRIRGLRMKRDFYLITHKRRSLPNPYRTFHDYIREHLAQSG